ncbi:hypothetical protein H4582DRAFT_2083626 [Lactarius indigo]|nr:hypothetical protein H4582DRAFT_2083626 [Lactarius indigo]
MYFNQDFNTAEVVGRWEKYGVHVVQAAREDIHTPGSVTGTSNREDHDNPKFWMLDSLMELNGHAFIDILKIDIESAESDALTAFLSARAGEGKALPVGQL